MATGITFLFAIPFTLLINITLSKLIGEPVIDVWDILSVFILLIVSVAFIIGDYARKKGFLSHLKIQGSEVKRYLKNVSVRYIYGKMLILTFEDSEEEILNHIVSYISTGTKAFQVVENARTELRFDGLEIDVAKRLVRKL